MQPLRTALTSLALVCAAAASPARGADAPLGYNRDIRPILSDKCFFCHGPDKGKRKAGLRLDVREAALAEKAIVPGKPDDSELIARITARDPDDVMPPPDSHKTLTAAQIELLRRWITEGAAYEPHWAYGPWRRPQVPPLSDALNPIDAFIGARLAEKGLAPSPPADRRTLLRRLSLDLIGLPPTPAEIEAFVADRRPDAYQRQVDRLLASPHFGERMAVPWLDLVRFADTVGYHGDQNVNVFPYRDWVIDAFNRNQRFDTFTIDQIAGDLVPRATQSQLIASGFNRLNMVTREGGAQPKEYLAKYVADRVRTVSTAWLGSTMGCAECHDHKYDPFTQKDFYSLGAFFADLKQWGVYHDYGYSPNVDLRGFSNEHPFPPEIEVPSAYLVRRLNELTSTGARELAAETARLAADPAALSALAAWRAEQRAFLRAHTDGFVTPRPDLLETLEGKVAVAADGALTFVGKPVPPAKRAYDRSTAKAKVRLPVSPGWLTSLRVELLPGADGRIVAKEARDGVVFPSAVRWLRKGDTVATHVKFFHADARWKKPTYLNGHAVPGFQDTGWLLDQPPGQPLPLTGVWQLGTPIFVSEGDQIVIEIKAEDVSRVRLATSPLPWFGAGGAVVSGVPFGLSPQRALAQAPGRASTALTELYLMGTQVAPVSRTRRQTLLADIARCHGGTAPTVVSATREPLPMRILPRGNWQDETGAPVEPAVPHFLPPLPPAPGRRNRLDLARWLVAKDNPLTARALVNRLWKQFYGVGLSSQLNDLGSQGEWPSHPELLDWLAADMVEGGWDIKRFVKQLVTSRTYQQASVGRPELRDVDPDNRLLARQSPRRLDAEFVRDGALKVAGLLDLALGGPSVFPYQPDGHWDNIQFPLRPYPTSTGIEQHRRGLYVHWQRTFVHPMLVNFDAPSREECTADRTQSNSPQQALTLLNDPTFVEAARVFASHLVDTRRARSDAERIGDAFLQALGRPPREAEQRALQSLLLDQRGHFRAHEDDARRLVGSGATAPAADVVELAAWTEVARVIFNLHEFITRV